MRFYADLKVKADILRLVDPHFLFNFFTKVGVKEIAFSIASNREEKLVESFKNEVQNKGLRVARRIDLEPRVRKDLLNLLRGVRRRFDVIGVRCLSRGVALTAVRDGRVDLVNFPLDDLQNRFSKKLAGICRNNLEVVVQDIRDSKRPLHIVLSRLIGELNIAIERRIKVVISSGAEDVYSLRSPRCMAALGDILGLGWDEGMAAVSSTPISILFENRERTKEDYIMDGVKVIR